MLDIPACQSKQVPSVKEVEPNQVDYRGYFDGGCQCKVASGGYLLFDHDGGLVVRSVLYYGYGYTYNEAEAMASRTLYEAIVTMVSSGKTMVVYGDFDLVMGFLRRASKPGKAALLMIMQ